MYVRDELGAFLSVRARFCCRYRYSHPSEAVISECWSPPRFVIYLCLITIVHHPALRPCRCRQSAYGSLDALMSCRMLSLLASVGYLLLLIAVCAKEGAFKSGGKELLIGEGGAFAPCSMLLTYAFSEDCLLARILLAIFCYLFNILYFCVKLEESCLLSVSF